MKVVRSLKVSALVMVFSGLMLFGVASSAHAGVNPSKTFPVMPQPKPALPKASPAESKAPKKETKKCGSCCKVEPASASKALAPKFVPVDLAIPGIQMILPAETLPEPEEPVVAEPEPPAENPPKLLGIGGTPRTE